VEGNLWVKEVKVAEEGDRYLLCYNPYRAEEDRKAREAIVAQLEEKISSGNVRGPKEGHRGCPLRRQVDLEDQHRSPSRGSGVGVQGAMAGGGGVPDAEDAVGVASHLPLE